MSRTFALLLIVTATAGLGSCGESRGERDTCGVGRDLCDEEGVIRCNSEEDAIETCLRWDGDCLAWAETTSCGSPGSCIDAECLCEDSCPGERATRCSGSVIETCVLADSGCLFWESGTDCSDLDQWCDEADGEAVCASGCPEACIAGDERCFEDVIQRCEEDEAGCAQWQETTDCASEDQYCDESTGSPQCVDECSDLCEFEGERLCTDTIIVRCSPNELGCLTLIEERDCALDGLVCNEEAEPICSCAEICEPGESRCESEIVQSCTLVNDLCWGWVNVMDCSEMGLPCDDSEVVAECVNGSGDDCSEPLVITSYPYEISGSSFADDFANDHFFSHSTCVTRLDSPEVIFAVDAEAGSRILMTETASVDVVISVQSSCDPSGTCELSLDEWGAGYLVYDVETAGRYFIIFETSGPTTAYDSYRIEILVASPEDCSDGIDNDLDDAVDCDDDECFGDPTSCSSETNCADDLDNDDDGAVDCVDSDCSGSPWCEDNHGLWELFEEGDLPDIWGYSITYTPNPMDPYEYSWTTAGGVTDYPVTPGSGTVTEAMFFSDDDYDEWILTLMPSFTYYDVTYDSVYIGSNGFITFGAGSDAFADLLDNHFAIPSFSGLRRDLNPSRGGTITVDEFSDRLVVTFDEVPRFSRTDPFADPSSFQMILNADGSLEVHYVTSTVSSALIGISSGIGDGDYPPEVNFIP